MRIAVIGTGGIARRHLSVLIHEPEIEIAGHVSPTPGHAALAAQTWGGGSYTRLEDLLQHEQVDAVWICVPPAAHGSIERRLIEHSIPFLIEKPLSADRQTAEDIAQLLATHPVIAAVGYHWRALDTLPEVRAALAQNPAQMALGAWHGATPPPPWWRHQAESGGQVVEQATHLFDLARFLLGEAEVIAATAQRHQRPAFPDADVANVSAALLRFDSGAAGSFTTTCLLGGPAAIHLQLVGEGLLITITQQGVIYDNVHERREVRIAHDPIQIEDRAFLDAVRYDDPARVLSSYADALLTHRLCFDVVAASQAVKPATADSMSPNADVPAT